MTVRELARRLGLGKSTVAAALRGNPAISTATRERVQAKAREWGYTLNPVASAFLQQIRSKGAPRYRANLAFLSEPYGISIPLRAIHDGITARAIELGYSVDQIDIKQYNSINLTRILLARGVLGVVIGPLFRYMGHMTLDWSKFGAVAYGYSMVRPLLHRVVHNHALGLRTIFRQGQRKGYKRIGLVLDHFSDQRSNNLWLAAFLALQQRLPPAKQVRPLYVPYKELAAPKILRWMRAEKPDLIIFHHWDVFARMQDFVRKTGIPIALLDRYPTDTFPGIDQQYARSGAMAVDLLSLQILHNERGIPNYPTTTMVDGSWVEASLPLA